MALTSWRGDGPKQITHAPDGMDGHIRRRIGQAPPQPGDMGFQRVGRHFVIEAIKPFFQHRARDDLTGAAEQYLQQVGFPPGRIDRLTRDRHLTGRGIERHVASRQDGGEASPGRRRIARQRASNSSISNGLTR